jgi:hypothetical protein
MINGNHSSPRLPLFAASPANDPDIGMIAASLPGETRKNFSGATGISDSRY